MPEARVRIPAGATQLKWRNQILYNAIDGDIGLQMVASNTPGISAAKDGSFTFAVTPLASGFFVVDALLAPWPTPSEPF